MATRRTATTRRPLSRTEEAFIRAFARALIAVPRALDADLLREKQLAQSEYFVLMHLSEAPGCRLRMSELAGAAAISLSGMTRIVSNLDRDGLVTRERSADDGRGWYAVLTERGHRRLQDAWPAHLASVRRRIFDHLDGVDLRAITLALQQMAGHSETAGAAPCDEAS
ncbi:MAG: transcriptional regulator, MarR family [Frankiales bacterium]|jgi:DNA-binding MarR family transcriptional regulator|nr:transcriptional regulator, MarR family [Frankiales bacterium]